MTPKDTKIYICTHTDFEPVVHNPIYEVVDSRNINGDRCENGLRGAFYSELFHYRHIAENYDLPKYVGVCGYRKYFSFMDNVPDIPSILQEYDAIAATPVKLQRTIRENQMTCANMEDFDILGGIIARHYPHLLTAFNQSLDTNITYAYNMFIVHRDDFRYIVRTVFDMLDYYIEVVGTDIDGRIASNPQAYHIGERRFLTPQYQYRIGGFLAERITNILLPDMFHRIKHYDVVKFKRKR